MHGLHCHIEYPTVADAVIETLFRLSSTTQSLILFDTAEYNERGEARCEGSVSIE